MACVSRIATSSSATCSFMAGPGEEGTGSSPPSPPHTRITAHDAGSTCVKAKRSCCCPCLPRIGGTSVDLKRSQGVS